MRRFRFRLSAALQYRDGLERDRRRALAALQQELAGCNERIDACLSELRDVVTHRSGQSDLSDLALVRQRELYSRLLSERAEQLREERGLILERLDAARADCVAAAQARKAIQRVRDKDYAEHVRAVFAEEQALLDEVGGRTGVRRER